MATRIFNTRDFTKEQLAYRVLIPDDEWEKIVSKIRDSMKKTDLVFHKELDLVQDLINRWIQIAETKETYGSIQESMNNLVDVYLYNDIDTVARYLEHCIQYKKTELSIGEAEELSELSESDWMIPDANSKPSFGIHMLDPYCEKLITITYEGNEVDGWFLTPDKDDDEVVFVVESNKVRIPIYWEDALRLVTT
jgi:hypothetical protein